MTFYDTLGVSPEATSDEIKRAYRQKAKETHPDINSENPNAEEEFKKISEAYSVLGDEEKRQQYDFSLKNPGFSPGGHGINIEDLFNSHFGGFGGFGGQPRQRQKPNPKQRLRGSDVRIMYDLPLYMGIFGGAISGRLKFESPCSNCAGHGYLKYEDTCTDCGGSGQHVSINGNMRMSQSCPSCRGLGLKPSDLCSECGGSGKQKNEFEYNTEVPSKFIYSNEEGVLVVPNMGAPGINGGEKGNLIIQLKIKLPKIDIDNITEEEKEILKKYLDN